jgi:outer membrane protein assembly factor BamE
MPLFLNILKLSLLAGALLGLSACNSLKPAAEGISQTVSEAPSRFAEVFRLHTAEVVQGNVVSREQLQLLRPGMTRQQVRDLLGTPLIISVFHANRWDYAFTIRRQGAEPLHRKLSVFFDGDAMVRVESDELPLESEFAARLDTKRPVAKSPVLDATPESLSAFKRQVPATASAPPASQSPLPDYPPLEPSR